MGDAQVTWVVQREAYDAGWRAHARRHRRWFVSPAVAAWGVFVLFAVVCTATRPPLHVWLAAMACFAAPGLAIAGLGAVAWRVVTEPA